MPFARSIESDQIIIILDQDCIIHEFFISFVHLSTDLSYIP